jgi:hypothetical protein
MFCHTGGKASILEGNGHTMATIDAEKVRVATSKAFVKIANGNIDAALDIIGALCTECVGLVQGEKMAQEQEDLREGRFDLSALTVDLNAPAEEREG